ncbi:MAG: tetratricopeptide repeat protein [Chlamydiota bacterium]
MTSLTTLQSFTPSQQGSMDKGIENQVPEYITEVPPEIFDIIGGLAGNLVFLPTVARMHVHSNPPYKEQAEAIADLARKKIVQLIIAQKSQFLDFSENDVKKFEARLALASKELANVWQELKNTTAQELFLEINQDLLNGCRDYLVEREGDLERIMHNPDAYVSSLTGIAVIYYELREFDKAENFFSKAVEVTKSLPDNKVFKCEVYQCEAFIKIALTASDMQCERKTEEFLQEASKVAFTIPEKKDRCAALLKIAQAYFKIENIEMAEDFLSKAEQSLTDICYKNRSYAFIEIIKLYFKIGNKKRAEKLLTDTENAAKVLNGEEKARLLSSVGAGYAELKNVKEAERVASEISNDFREIKDLPLMSICNVLTETGNLQEAERILNMILDPTFKEMSRKLLALKQGL